MADIAALATLLAGARYATAVSEGRNRQIVDLLNADALASRWDDVDAIDFFDAVKDETLTSLQEARLSALTRDGVVLTSRAKVRSWIQAQNWSGTTLSALQSLAQRTETHAEAAGVVDTGGLVTLGDVRRAVAQIPTSYSNAYRTAAAQATAARVARLEAAGLDVATTADNSAAKEAA